MCGIAGIVAGRSRGGDRVRSIASAMTARLVHRGPDAGDVWHEDGVAFGHRRLSILDLSPAGAQPMHSACGRYVLVLNGEIYNHLDLRKELEASGDAYQWRGHSDTETLLAAVARWGLSEALQRTRGMFALGLWDKATKRLSLARDRMGEKPLYWGWAGQDLVFGSELKALTAHPDCDRSVCRVALTQYLQFCYVPAPRSIHPGVYKLEPGTILECDATFPSEPPAMPLRPGESLGPIRIYHYWNLNDASERGQSEPITSDAEAVGELERVLRQSVQRQMLSDVPLGAFLSGGIDSSTVVALMTQESKARVKTFTIGFDVAGFDESPHARAVADHLGTDHHTIHVTEADALDVIPGLPNLYDEPFADSSQIPTHLVCAAARRSVTVALSGDGADELFGGYNRYFWGPQIWDKLRPIPFPVRKMLGRAAVGMPQFVWHSIERLMPISRRVAHLGDKALRLGARLKRVNDDDELYRSLVSEWAPISGAAAQAEIAPSLLDDPFPRGGMSTLAERMMFQDLRTYLPDDILCKVDRAAMGVSLETRAPFLDAEVVELSMRLDPAAKIRANQGKWALRQVLYQYVPQAIIDRPKAGFAIPVGVWLRGPLRDWAEALLATDALETDGLLDPVVVRRAWEDHLSGQRDMTSKLWIILMFMAWRQAQR